MIRRGLKPTERELELEKQEKLRAVKARIRERAGPKKTGRIKTKWVVRGEVFYSKRAAAEKFGVSERTILYWCRGRDGSLPEPECYCERLK